MAPLKRKRNDRASVDSGGGGGRPSPHRPGDTSLGQRDRPEYQDGFGRGVGRGGRGPRRMSERQNSYGRSSPSQNQSTSASTPGPASPALTRPASSQSQSAAAPNSSTPAAAEKSLPSPTPSTREYATVTDDRIASWAQTGRQEVVECGVQARDEKDVLELSSVFQELIQSVMDGRLDAGEAGACVKAIIGTADAAHASSGTLDARGLFLDTVSIYAEMESDPQYAKVRDMMVASGVPTSMDRQVLDVQVLQNIGLIRDSFVRLGIRHSTNLLYRQANYNLLREETEGYSKLTTELFTTSSSEAPTAEIVLATFERVKGLIGTFDLDVGRVLDVTLDVFAAVLIKQFRFFIKFLRVSSWWPRNHIKTIPGLYVGGLPPWALPEYSHYTTSEEDEREAAMRRRERDIRFWQRAREIHLDAFFELGGREVPDSHIEALANEPTDESAHTAAEKAWIKTTKTLPPPGNRVAAQLLGFKLRFYTSDARDEEDVLPANLLYLAALLIKVGFISLVDLYPHLWPSDEDLEASREKKMKELEEKERASRPGAASNALMMAGALTDDTAPPSMASRSRDAPATKTETDAKTNGATTEAKSELPEPMDQKVQLLNCLLTIGALPEALFMLGRFPWLPEAYPELYPLIHRILNHSIHHVFEQARPKLSTGGEGYTSKMMPEVDQTGVPKGTVKLGAMPSRRPLRWPFPDKIDANENTSYRFYWDEWADNIPVCQTVDDIFTLCSTLLNISGVNIGKDPSLVTKLAIIGLMSLSNDRSQANLDRWQDLLRRLLVPALSLTSSNPSAVNAVWDLLKQYPVTTRYTIYAEWYEGQISRLPAMRAAFARTRLETLSTMKRLSLTNLSSMARTLAKTAFASPGIVFKVALDQIEAYSNLIEAFVECAKYFTELGYDVLVWSLMNSLVGANRSRTQETSVLLTSKWLQALSKFSGKVFKRYSIMDPTPVIHYVNNQLYRGNSTDLIILKELISTMGGVVPDVDFTDAQLKAMSGGEVLRRQTLINLQDKRFESVKSARRLMRALFDSGIAGKLLVNIAQYRQRAIYDKGGSEAHIKYVATITDDAHEVLVQYLDLLRSNLEPEQFDKLVPGVAELITTEGLDVGLAFMLCRASLAHHMAMVKPTSSEFQDQVAPSKKGVDHGVDTSGDTKMSNGVGPDEQVATVNGADDKMEVDSAEAKDASGESGNPSEAHTAKKADPFLDVLQPIVDSLRDTAPDDAWTFISPEFFVIFWTLQLGDLAVPLSSYETEHERLNKLAEDVMKDRSDMTRSGMNRKDEKKRALLDAAKSIRDEMYRHVERYQKMRSRLSKQSKQWFAGSDDSAASVADALIERCIFPRLTISAMDTDYCNRLIRFLHENRVPNFKLMTFYDRLFTSNSIRAAIFQCTVREAEHFGRFLKAILADLSRWHADKAVYEKEALGQKEVSGTKARTLTGFATALDSEGKPQSCVEHPQFRDMLYGWHKNLNTALKSCLAGMEWMHIRNAITVLKAVLDSFPAVDFMARQFMNQLKTITDREAASKTAADGEEGHRVDLSVTAQTAYSELQKRKSKWVMVQAFRPNLAGESQEEGKRSDGATASSLRPTAPEFKPQPVTSAPKRTMSIAEVEDGEVKDGKDAKEKKSSDGGAPAAPAAAQKEPTKPAETQPAPVKDTAPAPSAAPKPASAAPSGKPSTPRPAAAVPASSSSRQEPSKPTTLAPVSHSLPSRPDVPLPGRIQSDRFGQVRTFDRPPVPEPPRVLREPRGDSGEPRHARGVRGIDDPREGRDVWDPRDPRDHRDGREMRDGRERDYRPAETSRPERPREYGPHDRRHGPEGISREVGPPSERDWNAKPEPPRRPDHGPQDRDRNDRGPARGAPATTGRSQDSSTRTNREAAPAPSTSQSSHAPVRSPSRGVTVNAEKSRSVSERPDLINPRGAAIVSDAKSGHRSPRDDGKDRDGARGQSPRPRGERPPHDSGPRESRDDRSSRPHHSEHRGPSRDDRPEPPPQTVSRSERGPDRGRDASFSGPFSGPRSSDSDSARYSHQDPNYGRLNPVPSSNDIPLGPRGRGRGTARMPSMNTPPRPEPRPAAEQQRAPSPETRQPPTGPASSRSRRSQPGPGESNGPSSNPPSTAPPAGPAANIHPDRLRQLNTNAQGSGSSQPGYHGPSAPTGPSHADRSSHGAGQPPPPSGQPHHQSRSSLAPLNTQDRPSMSSGLPGSRPSPTNTPSSSSFDNAPAGPSSATDRMRTGGRRQLAGINNTLQQATLQDSGRSGSLRRGSSRLSIPGSDAQLLAGHSRPATPSTERHEPLRRDQMPNDRPGGDGPSRPPPVDGGDHQRGDGDRSRRDRERSDRTDRSGRPSRRSSRERSPDREREPKEHREHRERRSGPSGLSASSTRDGERDSGSRRSGRDLPSGHWESQSGHRDANGATSSGNTGGRDSMGGSSSRESRHRGDRSSEQGTLRNEDWNRKRRTEEGVGGSSDRDKRQRR